VTLQFNFNCYTQIPSGLYGTPRLATFEELKVRTVHQGPKYREAATSSLDVHRNSFFDNHTINPLNAELNPICHFLVLLGDLTFMSPCIVSIFQYTRICISNKMQRYTVYLYLETALHVSGGVSTHHQELIQLYLQHLVFVTPLLLSAAIVEELEPV
jgi:hypothetical protein